MVQIVTDSSTLYSVEEARKAGFEAVPLCVHIGELAGRDIRDVSERLQRKNHGGE